jgi:catechol 2,3-dioxygenase-like lactoylglutathione lyase family enzyme
MTNSAPTTPWQGVNHIALQTPDLDATIRFYRDVVGMQVFFEAPAGEMHGRHAGIQTVSGGSGTFLHFFENPNAQIVPPPDLLRMHWMPGALHHLSFTVPNEAAALALRDSLHARGITTTDVMDQGDSTIFLFLDNNGILLEANWANHD